MIRPSVTSNEAMETIRWKEVMGRDNQTPSLLGPRNASLAPAVCGAAASSAGSGGAASASVEPRRFHRARIPFTSIYREAACTAAAKASPRSE